MGQRIITALVLLVIVALALFASPLPYLMMGLIAVMMAVAGYEWGKLVPMQVGFNNKSNELKSNTPSTNPNANQSTNRPFAFIYAGAVMVSTLVVLYAYPTLWVAMSGIASVLWLFLIRYVVNYPEKVSQWHNPLLAVIGWVLLGATALSMLFLWQVSPWWLLYVFLLVWCADSGAYFVGKTWGKRKLSPKVSPNKSIEGLLGGLVIGAMVAVVTTVLVGVSNWQASLAFLLLSLVTIAVSVFGDLFESMLKREAGVKDSGRILPGHGGVLDRIDSQLSALPVFAFGWHWLGFLGWY